MRTPSFACSFSASWTDRGGSRGVGLSVGSAPGRKRRSVDCRFIARQSVISSLTMSSRSGGEGRGSAPVGVAWLGHSRHIDCTSQAQNQLTQSLSKERVSSPVHDANCPSEALPQEAEGLLKVPGCTQI